MGYACASTFSVQDTNTNDAANGAISCAFYDMEASGMYQCVKLVFAFVVCSVHEFSFTVTLLHADWSTLGCEMIREDSGLVTCACNHLTAFSILQARTYTNTHTHNTLALITTCVVSYFLLVQSPAVPTISTQPVPALVVTLSVVGGAVFLVLAVTGGAYIIWRFVK